MSPDGPQEVPEPRRLHIVIAPPDGQSDPEPPGEGDGTEANESDDTLTVPSDDLARVASPRTFALLETIREAEPGSIRETARLVGRDVKNVHRELFELAALGVLDLEAEGQARRPRCEYDEVVVRTPLSGWRDRD